jgi:hypothetical protein
MKWLSAAPPWEELRRTGSEEFQSIGCRMSCWALEYKGQEDIIWSTDWRGTPHGQPVGRLGRKWVV